MTVFRILFLLIHLACMGWGGAMATLNRRSSPTIRESAQIDKSVSLDNFGNGRHGEGGKAQRKTQEKTGGRESLSMSRCSTRASIRMASSSSIGMASSSSTLGCSSSMTSPGKGELSSMDQLSRSTSSISSTPRRLDDRHAAPGTVRNGVLHKDSSIFIPAAETVLSHDVSLNTTNSSCDGVGLGDHSPGNELPNASTDEEPFATMFRNCLIPEDPTPTTAEQTTSATSQAAASPSAPEQTSSTITPMVAAAEEAAVPAAPAPSLFQSVRNFSPVDLVKSATGAIVSNCGDLATECHDVVVGEACTYLTMEQILTAPTVETLYSRLVIAGVTQAVRMAFKAMVARTRRRCTPARIGASTDPASSSNHSSGTATRGRKPRASRGASRRLSNGAASILDPEVATIEITSGSGDIPTLEIASSLRDIPVLSEGIPTLSQITPSRDFEGALDSSGNIDQRSMSAPVEATGRARQSNYRNLGNRGSRRNLGLSAGNSNRCSLGFRRSLRNRNPISECSDDIICNELLRRAKELTENECAVQEIVSALSSMCDVEVREVEEVSPELPTDHTLAPDEVPSSELVPTNTKILSSRTSSGGNDKPSRNSKGNANSAVSSVRPSQAGTSSTTASLGRSTMRWEVKPGAGAADGKCVRKTHVFVRKKKIRK